MKRLELCARLIAATSLAISISCTGADDGLSRRAGSAPAPSAGGSCQAEELRGTANFLRRLTKQELTGTLTDLLGPTIVQDAQVQAQLGLLAADQIQVTIADLALDPAQRQPTAMLNVAAVAAHRVLDDAAVATEVLGSCAATSTIDVACAETIIGNFGLKAYRRPLTPDEVASYLASYDDSGGGVMGLKRVLVRFLLNPSLTYHVELGQTGETGTRVRLTDYEIASRVSYGTIGTMPDAELLRAAGAGELQTLDNVRIQVRRLVASDPRAKSQIDEFFRVYLQIDPSRLPDPNAAEAAAQSIDTTDLKNEMIQEAKEYYNHIIWVNRGSFSSLFTSTSVFPRNARMAAILEAPIAFGNTPSETTSRHAGILLRPAFLDSSVDRTAAMHRGATIRKGILCDALGDPPVAAVSERTAALGDLSTMGNRDQLTLLTDVPTCLGCHARINALGFALEGYDQLGMWRTAENLFTKGALTGTRPIDTSVSDLNIEPEAPNGASDATALQAAIASTTKARRCFATSAFELRHLRAATEADACALADLEVDARDAGSMMALFVDNIAADDIFWKGGNE